MEEELIDEDLYSSDEEFGPPTEDLFPSYCSLVSSFAFCAFGAMFIAIGIGTLTKEAWGFIALGLEFFLLAAAAFAVHKGKV